ncbi:MAG: hypothetical protein WCF67_12255 [Chitinophagaceae bacterium]
MAKINTAVTIPLTPLAVIRYGITEKKKAELDLLSSQVLDAQHDVEQFQAIVASLTEKSNKLQSDLSAAENNKAKTLNNKNLVQQLVKSAEDLKSNADIAFSNMIVADAKTHSLTESIKTLIDKLIFSVQVINKLGNLIAKRKALNPLISDDLINMMGEAGKAANNAVALTLVALKSAFAAHASNIESEAALALSYAQSMSLYKALTGSDADQVTANGQEAKDKKQAPSLQQLLIDAHTNAVKDYELTQTASVLATSQLNNAIMALNKAQSKMKSRQSSLAAANAAALAS